MTAKLPWSSDPGTTFESEVFLEPLTQKFCRTHLYRGALVTKQGFFDLT